MGQAGKCDFRKKKTPRRGGTTRGSMCLDSVAAWRSLFGLGLAVLADPNPCGQLHLA